MNADIRFAVQDRVRTLSFTCFNCQQRMCFTLEGIIDKSTHEEIKYLEHKIEMLMKERQEILSLYRLKP